ncbi:MAG: hypothetical protein Kow006_11930 [Gammaproteobacteria bacterium]
MREMEWQLDLRTVPDERLRRMALAADEIEECYRVLRKGGINIVGEVLKGQGTFYEMEHYPRDDVFDGDSFAQYYYHAHREGSIEHGHFHTFVRAGGMPAGMAPAPYRGPAERPLGEEAICHLIAISMDDYGFPVGLFAVNRWVTGESWYDAEDAIGLLDRFVIDHAFPSWPVNRWIGAMIQIAHPQISALLRQRDQVVLEWSERHPDRDVYEDRELEITGYLPIDVPAQIEAVRGECQRRLAIPAVKLSEVS